MLVGSLDGLPGCAQATDAEAAIAKLAFCSNRHRLNVGFCEGTVELPSGAVTASGLWFYELNHGQWHPQR